MPPTVEITHVQEFSASHRLHNPALSEEENRRIFGICNNLHGHGHNYVLEVSVVGAVPAETGMVMDLNVLSSIVRERIVSQVDHRHLNHDVPFLEGLITTAETVRPVRRASRDHRAPARVSPQNRCPNAVFWKPVVPPGISRSPPRRTRRDDFKGLGRPVMVSGERQPVFPFDLDMGFGTSLHPLPRSGRYQCAPDRHWQSL